ncbi:MAG: hypothetical protein AAB339_09195 [Elusimicrobiota bacterium]
MAASALSSDSPALARSRPTLVLGLALTALAAPIGAQSDHDGNPAPRGGEHSTTLRAFQAAADRGDAEVDALLLESIR